jgi:alpha/beta hydrolase fold
MSPWADLAGTGDSLKSKAGVDPVLTAEAVRVRARDYLGGADACDPSVSPIYARLAGLPPLLIQAGSHEILLDDAIRLAARAAHDDVAVTLDVVPACPTCSRPSPPSWTKARPRRPGPAPSSASTPAQPQPEPQHGGNERRAGSAQPPDDRHRRLLGHRRCHRPCHRGRQRAHHLAAIHSLFGFAALPGCGPPS